MNQMKVIYQNQTHVLQTEPNFNFCQLKVWLKTQFKRLPQCYVLVHQTPQKTLVCCQKDLEKVICSHKGEICFMIEERREDDYPCIKDEEKNQGLQEILSEKDEDSPQAMKTLNLDQIICSKLQKLLPGVVGNLKEELKCSANLKSKTTQNWKQTNPNMMEELYSTICKMVDCQKMECEQRMKMMEPCIQTPEQLKDWEFCLTTQYKNWMIEMEKERNRICELCCLLEERCTKGVLKCMMKQLEKLPCMMTEKRNCSWKCFMNQKQTYQRCLSQEQKQFCSMLESIEKNMEMIKCEYNCQNSSKMMVMCMNILQSLQECELKVQRFNKSEEMFCLKETDYSYIQCWMKEMQMYKCCWCAINSWSCCQDQWKNCPVENVQYQCVQKKLEEMCSTMNQCIREMKNRKLVQVCMEIKHEIEQFRKCMPLLCLLAVPGMHERHWKVIEQRTKINVNCKCSLQNCLDMGLMQHLDICREVCQNAQNEYNICQNLKEIQQQWNNCKLCLRSCDYEWMCLDKCEEMCEMIQKHMRDVENMECSMYYSLYKNQICIWKTNLKKMQQTMENMQKFQKCCQYMRNCLPMKRRMPKMEEQWKCCMNMWKQIMNIIELSANAKSTCCSDNFCTKVQNCWMKMQQMNKELNLFLSEVRKQFPRFWFVSNDQLLKMYACEDFKLCLKMCFEGVWTVEMDQAQNITHLVSKECERIQLCKPLQTKNKKIQQIYQQLQQTMKETMKKQCCQNAAHCMKENHMKWIENCICQFMMVCSQIWFTAETQKAIKERKLPQHYEVCQKNLNELVCMMQKPMNQINRRKVVNLIILANHGENVVNRLNKDQICSVEAFEWMKFVRNYWLGDKCQVRCLNTCIPYGYEYLGTNQILVITSLTEKCYITYMSNMKEGFNSAAMGPAGCGKTQTMKDLSRILGMAPVTVNCSDQMNYKVIYSLLKGITSTGCWCTFDEFNRLTVPILSVFAQQMQNLAEYRNKGKCCIGDEEVMINPNYHIGITMNPGYAGRTFVPHNITQYFRSISMIVPNTCQICEHMFYSLGFNKGRILGKKMQSLFMRLKEQCSKQNHYDWGLRGMKQVVRRCGKMRTECPNMEEEEIFMNTMIKFIQCRLVDCDLELFNNLMKETFPKMKIPTTSLSEMDSCIRSCCEMNDFQPNKVFIEKVDQLNNILHSRHGVVVIGPTMTGKTSIQKVLMDTLQNQECRKIHKHVMNAKAMTEETLYGKMYERQWCDGIFTKIMRNCCDDSTNDEHWIVFDGPVDPIWVENLNVLLDDNKKLILPTGESIPLSPRMRVMFEVDNLCNASPATVSRCGTLWCSEDPACQMMVKSWMDKLPQILKTKQKMMTTLKHLLGQYTCQCMNFVKEQCCTYVPCQNEQMMMNLLRFLRCQLTQCLEEHRMDNLEKCLVELFHWCVVCVMGMMVQVKDRNKFDLFMRELCTKNMRKVFPEQCSVFDYYFCMKKCCWMKWMECLESEQTQMIPTKELLCNQMICQMLLKNDYNVMLVGNACTGKTQQLNLFKECQQFYQINMQWCPNTNVAYLQQKMMKQLEKRRKNIYGPPLGQKCLVCVDDADMPKQEAFGARPPVQFMNYLMEYRKLVDQTCKQWKQVQDCRYMMTKSSQNSLNPRFMSKFNIVTCPQLCEESMRCVYENALCNIMRKYPQNIRCLRDKMIECCLKGMMMAKEYNPQCNTMNDFWCILRSICAVEPKCIKTPEQMMNLCFYENMRVHCDKLPTQQSRNQFMRQFTQTMKCCQEYPYERVVFCNYLENDKMYTQVEDMECLMNQTQQYIHQYCEQTGCYANMMGASPEVCEMMCKICRVLRQPCGHMMLMGRNGCGRKTLTKIACSIMNYEYEECCMNNWKQLLMRSICENKKICMVLCEENLTQQMMTMICQLMKMNICEMFTCEEQQQICTMCKCTQPEMMEICIQRLKDNLHCVMCMNEKSQQCMKYPTIMNQSTVCWMEKWSDECLTMVGKKLLKPRCWENQEYVVEACRRIYRCVEDYLCNKLNCQWMTSQTQFLECLELFEKLCCERNKKYQENILNIRKGICLMSQMQQHQLCCLKKQAWELQLQQMMDCMSNVTGDCIIDACMVVYGCMFTTEQRQTMKQCWKNIVRQMRLCCSDQQFLMQQCLCQEEMMMIQHNQSIPLIVDPQREMRNMMMEYLKCKGEQMYVCCEPNMLERVQKELSYGKWVLLNYQQCGCEKMMKWLKENPCKKVILWTDCMVTDLQPEFYQINCTITQKKMQQMLQSCLMKMQCPTMCQKLKQLQQQQQQMECQMMSLDKCLCTMLTQTDPSQPLSMEMMNCLKECKMLWEKMQQVQQQQQQLMMMCHKMMQRCRPIVQHIAALYCCLCEVMKMNQYYQYSCEWFMEMFCNCVKECPPYFVMEKKTLHIIQSFTKCFYKNVCCELFEEDRKMFSFLMICFIMRNNCQISEECWQWMMSQMSCETDVAPKPCSWMPDYIWNQCYHQLMRLNNMDMFKGICQHFIKNHHQWKRVCDSSCPWMKKFPAPYDQLNMFEKMMVVKAICPDQFIPCMMNYCTMMMGEKGQFFISNVCRTIKTAFLESTPQKPIFLMQTEQYNMNTCTEWKKCAQEMNMKCCYFCMDECNQQQVIEQVKKAACEGYWILIDNCWWDSLMEQCLKNLKDCHKDFRFWSIISNGCQPPHQMMTNCVKVPMQPITEFKDTMMWLWEKCAWVSECKKPEECMKIMYGCCVLHAMVMKRQRCQPVQWYINACFSDIDFDFCCRMVMYMLNNCKQIDWCWLQYMVGEILYGGPIMMDQDKRIMCQLTRLCLNPQIMKPGYCFASNNAVIMPEVKTHQQYMQCINKLPPVMYIENLWLSENTAFMKNMMMGTEFMKKLCAMNQPAHPEQQLQCLIESLLKQIPCNMECQQSNSYDDCMNMFLWKEVQEWNKLFMMMRKDLNQMKKQLMCWKQCRDLCALMENRVPDRWCPYKMKLNSFMHQMKQKVAYLQKWMKEGKPQCYDLQMFLNLKNFFLCVKQNYARKYNIPMEKICLQMNYLEKCQPCPENGCYVSGIWIRAGCWDEKMMKVVAPQPHCIFNKMPMMHLVPICEEEMKEQCFVPLNCATMMNRHSWMNLNFLMMMNLPTQKCQEECIRNCMCACVYVNL